MAILHSDLTGSVLRCFYRVFNVLGHGFLERVYESALMIELESAGHSVERQRQLEVFYEGLRVGYFYADIIVDDRVILEIKAAAGLIPEHEAQLLNYLKASRIEVGLLLNFGPTPSFKRLAYDNTRKTGNRPPNPRRSA